MSSIQEDVRSYVIDRTGHADVPDDADLFESGLANSLLAVQIVMWLDRTMGVQVTEDELDMRNFSSINAITQFVDRKRTN